MEMQGEAQMTMLDSETIEVAMQEEFLFDFFLYHAYSKFQGFLTNILGFAIFILGAYSYWAGTVDGMGCGFFIAASILFIAATPIQLKLKARRAMQEESCARPVTYEFTDGKGILATAEDSRFYAWEDVRRAAVAPKTIILYLEGEKALVFPKAAFGEKFGKIYQMIAVNLARCVRSRNASPKEAPQGLTKGMEEA